jgi:hypothetical protein
MRKTNRIGARLQIQFRKIISRLKVSIEAPDRHREMRREEYDDGDNRVPRRRMVWNRR